MQTFTYNLLFPEKADDVFYFGVWWWVFSKYKESFAHAVTADVSI